MYLTPQFDTSRLESAMNGLIETARNDSIGQVAKTYGRELPLLYAKGIGGDGVAMHGYNSSYAARMGISSSPKTLKRSEGRLYDMVLEGNILTVTDSEITTTTKKGETRSVSARTVALGQQTGASGRWPYSNIMFGPNESLQETAAQELASYLTERIHA